MEFAQFVVSSPLLDMFQFTQKTYIRISRYQKVSVVCTFKHNVTTRTRVPVIVRSAVFAMKSASWTPVKQLKQMAKVILHKTASRGHLLPLKYCPFLWGSMPTVPHLICGFGAHPSPRPKWHLDRPDRIGCIFAQHACDAA